MGKILNLIEGNMNGDAWEDLCVRCYRMKYQEQHYVAIPAVHKGDAGIEGYTKSGIVHQCYCPERSYSDNELYDHQRDKLSADIKKLMENGSRMKSLGIPPIHEWHFNISELVFVICSRASSSFSSCAMLLSGAGDGCSRHSGFRLLLLSLR